MGALLHAKEIYLEMIELHATFFNSDFFESDSNGALLEELAA